MTKVTGQSADAWSGPEDGDGAAAPDSSIVSTSIVLTADLYRCPDCDGDALVVTDEDAPGEFLCLDCGRCWRVGWGCVAPVDPATCPARAYQDHCRLLGRRRAPAGRS